jgi:hypothetical protein
MSPCKVKNEEQKGDTPMIGNNDQTKMILKGLGMMNADIDLSFVTSEYALKYIDELED